MKKIAFIFPGQGSQYVGMGKDFYEKDLAPEYKGAVTQPITYGTTSAYGIKYPKTDLIRGVEVVND